MNTPLNQVPNPTKEERHEMLWNALVQVGRTEDYEYILKFLSPPADITNYAAPGELHGVKIGIIGGGLAGMCAAYELRKLGADITILEASKDRIGGRVYTYYFDRERRYYGEFGAMRIPASHETSWHYIDLFQLSTLSLTTPLRNNFLYVHNTRLRTTDSVEQYLYPKYALTTEERSTPWNELLDYATTSRFRALPPQIRSELIQILPDYSPEFEPLMKLNLRQNFEDLGLSQGAIQLISSADPISGALLHISYDEIAHEEYTLDYRNTYRIQDGNDTLARSFYQSLQEDYPPEYSGISPAKVGTVNIKMGHIVTGIYRSDYRNKIIIKYTGSSEEDAADIFDYVICAIPLSSLRNVEIKPFFSNQKTQAIMEMNYIDALKSLFLCDRRFWERSTDYGGMLGGISFTDLAIQSIIYPGDHNPCASLSGSSSEASLPPGLFPRCSSEEPGVLIASYNLEQNSVRLGGMNPIQRYEVIRQNVEEVHGLMRGFLGSIVKQVKTVHWNNEPFHRGALAYTLPNQKRLFSYELLQPEYNGRLFLAGEHASAKHGWMQGALYSGKSAANRLAELFHSNHSRV